MCALYTPTLAEDSGCPEAKPEREVDWPAQDSAQTPQQLIIRRREMEPTQAKMDTLTQKAFSWLCELCLGRVVGSRRPGTLELSTGRVWLRGL